MNLLADNERVYREWGRLVLKHGVMPLQVHDVGLAALNLVGFTGLRVLRALHPANALGKVFSLHAYIRGESYGSFRKMAAGRPISIG